MKMKIYKKLSGGEFRIEEIEITSFEYDKNKEFTFVRSCFSWYEKLKPNEFLLGVEI